MTRIAGRIVVLVPALAVLGTPFVTNLPALAVASTGSTGIVTQTAPHPDGNVFRAMAELIRLDVSVTDSDGLAITDLLAATFALFQDGQPQAIL
jgi:hypothetical protein